MGTLLDLLNDPVKSQQLPSALEAGIKSLLMANSGIHIDTNRFADFPKTHFVRFNASDLRSWDSDDASVSNFIGDSAYSVIENLKTLGITTVGSINAKAIPKEHMIEVASTY